MLGELVEQWTELHGVDRTPEIEDSVSGYPHRVYHDAQDNPVVEAFELQGMGHGIAVDPGFGPDQGGEAAWFAFDVGLWSSYHAAELWEL
jgi:poly(3-hydroxybutyrate) depolymerase